MKNQCQSWPSQLTHSLAESFCEKNFKNTFEKSLLLYPTLL